MTQNSEKRLEMSFMPNTIEHLGARLYSTLPPVLSELIANAYDADAGEVLIKLKEDNGVPVSISVIDDGCGMSFDEINEKFLRIGRNRRLDDLKSGDITPKNRRPIGKKGLGKLSFFGIADIIEVVTVQNRKLNHFVLDWNEINNPAKKSEVLTNYSPEIRKHDSVTRESDGTQIVLKQLKRRSKFEVENLADSISRFFILQDDFKIYIQRNNDSRVEVTNERRYRTLNKEFVWCVPAGISVKPAYEHQGEMRGELFTTEKPIPPNTASRGIALFSRGKLVNLPDYFSDSSSSHFYSYLSGWIEVDFIDDMPEDVIDTNRQSLDWSSPQLESLHTYLQQVIKYIGKDWRVKRNEKQKKQVEAKIGINLKYWCGTLPKDIRSKLDSILKELMNLAELPERADNASAALINLHSLIPEYPDLNWRGLDSKLKEEVEASYQQGDYMQACFEGIKRFVCLVKEKCDFEDKSYMDSRENQLLETAFSNDGLLSVIGDYRKPDGSEFTSDTKENIQVSTKSLATALWSGFSAPVGHETKSDLLKSKLFTEKDCLDLLSLLSYLYRRLEHSKKQDTNKPKDNQAGIKPKWSEYDPKHRY